MINIGLLKFTEHYVERIWGGERLRALYDKATPTGVPIGEAWLIADHMQHVSVVADGPEAGRTLRDMLEQDAGRILGTRVRLTIHGRFPLLLKLLDAGDKLSVQVHPDDRDAQRLNERDVGKTEMWYVLHGEDRSELYCGVSSAVTRERFAEAVEDGTVADLITRIPAREGTAVLVPAGTVHAIGGGCLLAEIQQNSDITYRIDDWGRVQSDGSPRKLHVDRALEVTNFGSRHAGAAKPLAYTSGSSEVSVLAACKYFAAESVRVTGRYTCDTRGETFTLLLGTSGTLRVSGNDDFRELKPACALMVPGSVTEFTVEGEGSLLKYFVPDLDRDIMRPLLRAGHPREAIIALGGDPRVSDLAH